MLLQRAGLRTRWPAFLRVVTMDRRLQLAQRLADLYDQYQVYRSDWLAAWADGHDVLPAVQAGAAGPRQLPADQRWQALLWRELLAAAHRRAAPVHPARLAPALHWPRCTAARRWHRPAPWRARGAVRHDTPAPADAAGAGRAVAALPGAAGRAQPLPLPLGRHHRRPRTAAPAAPPPPAARPGATWPRCRCRTCTPMRTRCWPPGAARGATSFASSTPSTTLRAAVAALCLPRVDLFDEEAPARPCCSRCRQRIRDLVPLGEHAREAEANIDAADRSIVFHIAHSAQREVEILHDQLLALLAQAPVPAARPRCSRATSSSWCPTSRPSRPPSARCLASTRVATPAPHPATTLPTCRSAATTRCWWRWNGCCGCRSSAAA
jgi:exodeoxyribonuclease V gamma subunit